MQVQERCPQVNGLTEILTRIFEEGIPLPVDRKVTYSNFTSAARIPHQSIQHVSIDEGKRDFNSIDSWSATGVENTKNNGSENCTRLNEKLDILAREAFGLIKPVEVPGTAERISGGTMNIANRLEHSAPAPSLTGMKDPRVEELQ